MHDTQANEPTWGASEVAQEVSSGKKELAQGGGSITQETRRTISATRLVVIGEAPMRNGVRYALCRCVCGAEKSVRMDHVRNGSVKSCGCMRRKFSHGQTDSRLYRIWTSMLARCRNKAHKAYPDYGGRGIVVCLEWLEFSRFHADMGDPPAGHSLERKDNSIGYQPGNCVWATRKDQQRNTRRNRTITIDGETLCMAAWSERTGVRVETMRGRIADGWDVKEAVFQKPDRNREKRAFVQ